MDDSQQGEPISPKEFVLAESALNFRLRTARLRFTSGQDEAGEGISTGNPAEATLLTSTPWSLSFKKNTALGLLSVTYAFHPGFSSSPTGSLLELRRKNSVSTFPGVLVPSRPPPACQDDS